MWLETHPLPIGPKNSSADVEDSPAADPTNQMKVKSRATLIGVLIMRR
jgi:hypothetical protein